ncbi:hypothetical protein [Enterococcus faecalis]|uniref:hypothetical protein n=1 Tax=Enterococcus faecalis TaxID=1351 RepID=UPI001A9715A2|nr:hypothetical protein [Enterococcus faecalis]MBO1137587.1 hypothetical protein [Enterococcus faecalis]
MSEENNNQVEISKLIDQNNQLVEQNKQVISQLEQQNKLFSEYVSLVQSQIDERKQEKEKETALISAEKEKEEKTATAVKEEQKKIIDSFLEQETKQNAVLDEVNNQFKTSLSELENNTQSFQALIKETQQINKNLQSVVEYNKTGFSYQENQQNFTVSIFLTLVIGLSGFVLYKIGKSFVSKIAYLLH